jgi:hypothetical protein
MMERFTDYARSAVWRGFRRRDAAPERDVVAALASGRGVAGRLLREVGVAAGDLPATAIGRQALIAQAVEAARQRGVNYVGTEHLLLAAAALPGSGLAERGASAGRLGELLSVVEAEWESRPGVLGRVAAWCRSALGVQP